MRRPGAIRGGVSRFWELHGLWLANDSASRAVSSGGHDGRREDSVRACCFQCLTSGGGPRPIGLLQLPDDVPASLPFDCAMPPDGPGHRGMVRSVDAGVPDEGAATDFVGG